MSPKLRGLYSLNPRSRGKRHLPEQAQLACEGGSCSEEQGPHREKRSGRCHSGSVEMGVTDSPMSWEAEFPLPAKQ
jgi:hypothetical protein